jgi:hypothetical protein
MRLGSTSVRGFQIQPTSEFSGAGKTLKPENSSKDACSHKKIFDDDLW